MTALCLLITGGSIYFAELQKTHASELRKENKRVIDEKIKTEEEKNKAELALEARERALKASRGHLYHSHLRTALALNSGRGLGQNFECLSYVRQAAGIVPALGLTPPKIERRHKQLRSTAVAAMCRWDLESVHSWSGESTKSHIAVDFHNQRVAQSDKHGNIAIRKFGERDLEFQLEGPNEQVPAWVPLFSSDGRFFIARYHDTVTLADPFVVLWDMANHTTIKRIDQVSLDAWHCFSGDSKLFAVSRPGNKIEIYSTDSAELQYVIQTSQRPRKMQFANRDRQLILWQDDLETIDFWSLDESPKVVHSIPIEEPVSAIDWIDESQHLAVAIGKDILVWPPGDLAAEPTRLTGHTSRVVNLALNPRSKILMSSSWDGTTRLFDLNMREEAVRIEGQSLTFSGFDPSGRQIGYSGQTAGFGIWQLPPDLPIKMITTSPGSEPRKRAIFVPNFPELIAYGTDEGVEIWNHRTQSLVNAAPTGNTRFLQFHVDGSELITSGETGIQRWKFGITQGESGAYQVLCDPIETLWEGKAYQFDFHEKEQRLIAKAKGNRFKILDLDDNSFQQTGSHQRCQQAVFDATGNRLVSASWQGLGVKVWDAATGTLIKDLLPDTSSASLTVNPTNNRLFVVSGDRIAEFDLNDLSEIRNQRRLRPDGWQGDASYSPNGKILAMIHSRYMAKLVDAESGDLLTYLSLPSSFMLGGISWSDDGNFLSISYKNQILVWDIDGIRTRMREMQIDWQSSSETSQ